MKPALNGMQSQMFSEHKSTKIVCTIQSNLGYSQLPGYV